MHLFDKRRLEGFHEAIPPEEDQSQMSYEVEAESGTAPENIVSWRNLDCEEDLSE